MPASGSISGVFGQQQCRCRELCTNGRCQFRTGNQNGGDNRADCRSSHRPCKHVHRRSSFLHGLVGQLRSTWRRVQSEWIGLTQWRAAANHESIDRQIAPLVNALNATARIKTIASCQGHPRRYLAPYVYFSCSATIAGKLEAALRDLSFGSRQRLSVRWLVHGTFNEDCDLRFRLCAPAYDAAAMTIVGAVVRFGFLRRTVENDLRALTELVGKISLQER